MSPSPASASPSSPLALLPLLALSWFPTPDTTAPPYYESTQWGQGWLWLTALAVILVSLMAWGLSRDRTHRPGGPPVL